MQPSPLNVQSHLYASFLHASTYDVALRVSGTWNAIYKLHRVVLIQSVRALWLSIIHCLFHAGIFPFSLYQRLLRIRNQADYWHRRN
jgi:hypothetical protein